MQKLAIAIALLAAGCAARPTTIRDTKTVHSADAARIWIVQQDPEGNERVVLCDVGMLTTSRTLCVRWPGP